MYKTFLLQELAFLSIIFMVFVEKCYKKVIFLNFVFF